MKSLESINANIKNFYRTEQNLLQKRFTATKDEKFEMFNTLHQEALIIEAAVKNTKFEGCWYSPRYDGNGVDVA